VVNKKLFISHKSGWLSGMMRYRTELATQTQVQGEQWCLPIIPSIESLLAGIRLNKKIL
jgi:hypothetical protein